MGNHLLDIKVYLMNKFLNLILGTTDVPTYLAGLLFALIGLAFY